MQMLNMAFLISMTRLWQSCSLWLLPIALQRPQWVPDKQSIERGMTRCTVDGARAESQICKTAFSSLDH